MNSGSILVTGGAGYIGSHVVKKLLRAGRQVVVLDNLSSGFRQAVLGAELVVGATGDQAVVNRLLAEHDISAVMHFAASTIVAESVADPLKYYANNTCSTRNLLECCAQHGIGQFIFSSTAAVYGPPEDGRCDEGSALAPINPYGNSKLMSEWMLKDLCHASDMRSVVLRYFNVAGSDPELEIGQATRNATLLIKVAAEAAVGKREQVMIYGTDYPTPDGTGVRDYIHVDDLAAAHIDALHYLENKGESVTLNCGYGHGYSVREVLDAVQRVAGTTLAIREQARRPGDPASLVAEAGRVRQVLGWQPRLDNLDEIVRTSIAWERKLQQQPW